MEVSEHLEIPKLEERAVSEDSSFLALPDALPPPPPPPVVPQLAAPVWLRLAYSFHFLLAVLVIVVGWTQIGGQGHMDLMPWYVKLLCIFLLAGCVVRWTAAIVEQPRLWNRGSRLWLTGVILAFAVMAGVTYYVHLHEVPDEPDTDETSTTSVRNLGVDRLDLPS